MKTEYTLDMLREELKERFKKEEDVIVKEISNDTLEITLKGDDKFSSQLFLGNMLKEVKMGTPLDDAIQRRLDTFGNLKQAKEYENNVSNWEFVKDKIIFVPQHKDYEKEIVGNRIKDKIDGKEIKFYTKPFINDLVLIGVLDFPGHIVYITKDSINKWGKSELEIEDQIDKNLMKYESDYRVDIIDNHIHIRGGGKGMLSTLLLRPRKLREIADMNGFGGKEIIGAIPFRDLVILTENNIEKAVNLWGLINSMLADEFMPYSLSSRLFLIDKDGVISPYKTDEIPGEGVVIGLDQKHRRMITMPLGRKEISLDGPTAEELEEEFRTNKNLQKEIMFIEMVDKMKGGLPAEEFIKFLMQRGHNKDEIKEIVKGLVDEGALTVEMVGDKIKFHPSKKLIIGLLEKLKRLMEGK